MHPAPKTAVIPRDFVHDASRNAAIPKNFVHCALKNALVPKDFVHGASKNAAIPRNFVHCALNKSANAPSLLISRSVSLSVCSTWGQVYPWSLLKAPIRVSSPVQSSPCPCEPKDRLGIA